MQGVDSTSSRIAAILIQVACISYYNIMPLILGGAADTYGLDESQLGLAAAAFMGGLGLINLTGFAWLRKYDWRVLVVVGNVAATAALIVPLISFTLGTWLLTNLIAGMATGISYGVAIACLGDTKQPERNFALAYAAQTFISAALIFALPRLPSGIDLFQAGQLTTVALMAISILLVLILPSRGSKTGVGSRSNGKAASAANIALAMALAVLVLNVMAEGAIWAFIERIAVNDGLSTKFAATVMAFSFFASGAGSIVAAIIGTRFGRNVPFLVAVAMSVTSVWVLWSGGTETMFFAGVMLFALAWNLGSPYRMALAMRADVSGRFSTLVPAMQTLGAGIGPAFAGMLVTGNSFYRVYVMCTIAWLVTIFLFFGAQHYLRRDPG